MVLPPVALPADRRAIIIVIISMIIIGVITTIVFSIIITTIVFVIVIIMIGTSISMFVDYYDCYYY